MLPGLVCLGFSQAITGLKEVLRTVDLGVWGINTCLPATLSTVSGAVHRSMGREKSKYLMLCCY